MSNAPERIWAGKESEWGWPWEGCWHVDKSIVEYNGSAVEYIRRDAITPAMAAEALDRELIAEAIWRAGYGDFREKQGVPQAWPDDVIGGSQELFRKKADGVIRAIAAQGEQK